MKSIIKRGLASLLIMVLACSFVVLPSKADTVSKLSSDLTQEMLTSTAFQDVMVVLRMNPSSNILKTELELTSWILIALNLIPIVLPMRTNS